MEVEFLYLYLLDKPPVRTRIWESESELNLCDLVDWWLDSQCVNDPNLVTRSDIYWASIRKEIVGFDSVFGSFVDLWAS